MNMKYNSDMICIVCNNTKKVPQERINIVQQRESKKKVSFIFIEICFYTET